MPLPPVHTEKNGRFVCEPSVLCRFRSARLLCFPIAASHLAAAARRAPMRRKSPRAFAGSPQRPAVPRRGRQEVPRRFSDKARQRNECVRRAHRWTAREAAAGKARALPANTARQRRENPILRVRRSRQSKESPKNPAPPCDSAARSCAMRPPRFLRPL